MARKKASFLLLLSFCKCLRITAQGENTMYAHYIDVGQGAAVLLEFPRRNSNGLIKLDFATVELVSCDGDLHAV